MSDSAENPYTAPAAASPANSLSELESAEALRRLAGLHLIVWGLVGLLGMLALVMTVRGGDPEPDTIVWLLVVVIAAPLGGVMCLLESVRMWTDRRSWDPGLGRVAMWAAFPPIALMLYWGYRAVVFGRLLQQGPLAVLAGVCALFFLITGMLRVRYARAHQRRGRGQVQNQDAFH